MSNSRPSIILVLKETFKNSEKAEEIRHATMQMLTKRPGSASRIFDKFPCLLPKETIQHISEKCLSILSNISITHDTNGIHVHNEKDQKNIELFIKEIISLGMKELLNKHGHIKMELITLLELESIKDQLSQPELIISILCGYVGAINQEIAAHVPKEILALNPVYAGFTGYLNKKVQNEDRFETNVRQWVIDKLTKPAIQNTNNKTNMVVSAINETSAMMFFKQKSMKNLNTSHIDIASGLFTHNFIDM